jgi:hypothetical protein
MADNINKNIDNEELDLEQLEDVSGGVLRGHRGNTIIVGKNGETVDMPSNDPLKNAQKLGISVPMSECGIFDPLKNAASQQWSDDKPEKP